MDGNPYPELEGFPNLATGSPLDIETDKAPDKAKRTRTMSAIDFPYVDLDQAIFVPETIHTKLGTKGLNEQLSGAMGHTGGSYARRMAAAKMFGFIEKDGDHYKITDLGRRVVGADTTANARVEAFLNVGLYRRLYEDFRGASLPADMGIENHMREVGVPDKAAESARQIFRRSARQAGFFPYGEDRLIMPALRDAESSQSTVPQDAPTLGAEQITATSQETPITTRVTQSTLSTDHHPLIAALIRDIPIDETWEPAKFKSWMETFEAMAKYVYGVSRA